MKTTDTSGLDDLNRDERDAIVAVLVSRNMAHFLHEENGELSGQFDCPKCSQPVAYSVAKRNGHTAGRCTTKECVAWLE